MTDPRARPAGEIVGGKYRLIRFLAAGGMGSVYEAQHTVVKRRVAVKFLRADLAVERASLSRFQREAQAAGALESEHIAAALDFGIAGDGSPFIVMEYLVGESLASLLEREKRLPIGRAADLVAQACRGVETAHASGIVHRDLKPQNLFVARRQDGTDLVKVLDFGVAKLEAEDQGAGTTRTGTVLGTPAYMSPEQARGEKLIDHRSDVYSLGAILYELLSGEKPHPGDSPNAVLYHIATHAPVPLAGLVPELPAELVASIEKAIAKDMGERQPSAAALAEELRAFSVREVHPAPKVEPSSHAAEGSSPTVLASGHAPSLAVSAVDTARPSAPGKARSGLATAIGWGAVGAAVTVAIGWASRTGNDRAGDPPGLETTSTSAANAPAARSPDPPEARFAPSEPSGSGPPPPVASTAPTASSDPSGRPRGRPFGRPSEPPAATSPVAPASGIASARPPASAVPPAPSVRFDQRNPYE
jgi:eukaryotic-like serine/threonine-protein kinase